jgi:hypothetical protein
MQRHISTRSKVDNWVNAKGKPHGTCIETGNGVGWDLFRVNFHSRSPGDIMCEIKQVKKFLPKTSCHIMQDFLTYTTESLKPIRSPFTKTVVNRGVMYHSKLHSPAHHQSRRHNRNVWVHMSLANC